MSEDVYKNAVAAFKKMAGSTTKEMSRKQFTRTLSQKYPEDFANLIFDTFDTDGNGAMSVCHIHQLHNKAKKANPTRATNNNNKGSFFHFDV